MILITETFEKLLLKIKSISLKDVELEINKHKSGLNNFKRIGELKNKLNNILLDLDSGKYKILE